MELGICSCCHTHWLFLSRQTHSVVGHDFSFLIAQTLNWCLSFQVPVHVFLDFSTLDCKHLSQSVELFVLDLMDATANYTHREVKVGVTVRKIVADVTFAGRYVDWLCPHAGPDYSSRQNNCSSLLVQHLPGSRDQREHPQSELSLEAGGCRPAGAPGGRSRGMAPPVCEASQEHHLYSSWQGPFPVICAAADGFSLADLWNNNKLAVSSSVLKQMQLNVL